MILLDGKALAKRIRKDLKQSLRKSTKPPGLAVILCGSDPASQIYVANKQKIALGLGFKSEQFTFDKNISSKKLSACIDTLNKRADIHGILLQLPLPGHLHAIEHLNEIRPEKDVDGFHPVNVGRVCLGLDTLAPCTPLGVIRLLRQYQVPILGANVVIVGKSNVVGRPLAQLFFLEHATVTVCHTETRDLAEHVKKADILVTAAGAPRLINAAHLGRDCVMVDVGINRLSDGSICGDLDFEDLKNSPFCKAISPVPGGVGPMTIAMLMQNTIKAFQRIEDFGDLLGPTLTRPALGEGY
jgi:methylenetetrahydrofolate dehydrogenase (NADP+) / methenyltetrahydrofolate cyclohydrolase